MTIQYFYMSTVNVCVGDHVQCLCTNLLPVFVFSWQGPGLTFRDDW